MSVKEAVLTLATKVKKSLYEANSTMENLLARVHKLASTAILTLIWSQIASNQLTLVELTRI